MLHCVCRTPAAGASCKQNPGTAFGLLATTKEVVQIADVQSEPAYASDSKVIIIGLAGARTLLMVPMIKDDELVGAIRVCR